MATLRTYLLSVAILGALLCFGAVPAPVCADEAGDAGLWRGGSSVCGGHSAVLAGQNIWGDSAPTPTPTPTATPTITPTPTPQIPANQVVLTVFDAAGTPLQNVFVTVLGVGGFMTNQLGQIVLTVEVASALYTAFIKKDGFLFSQKVELQAGASRKTDATGARVRPAQCRVKRDLAVEQLAIATGVKTIYAQLRAALALLPLSSTQRLARQAAALEQFNRVLTLLAAAPVADVMCQGKVPTCSRMAMASTKRSLAATARRIASQALSANRTLKGRKLRSKPESVVVDRLVKREQRAVQKSINKLPAATLVCS